MIPLELTIEGLYSYQKRQTIDFTKLTEAGLFGIFGTVGSGKSSILEAITYAIYGKTDKLNQSGDNRNYNMMNLKSNELLIDFIFETGKEQTKYRTTVKGRRNSKRFEDVKTFERKAYREFENEWLPIELGDLEKAVGLSYENFKRTIIIPQGQFQEFLQLGNRDRTQMMKELFNLQKYEFYYKVVSLESKNNSQKQLINGQLQQLGILDPYQVEVYNLQLKDLEINIKESNLKLVAYQKTEEQLRGLLDKIQKRDEAKKVLNNLIMQQPAFTELERRIIRYEQSVAIFKHLLITLKEYRAKVKTRREQISSDNAKLKTDNESIEELVKLIENIKPRYEKRDELKRKADELNTFIKIKRLEKTVQDESKSVDKGNKYWEETSATVAKLKRERGEFERVLSELRASMPDFALLSKIKMWYLEKHNLEQQAIDNNAHIERFVNRENELISLKENLLKDPIFKGASNLSFNECSKHLESATSQINKKQTELIEQKSHILVKAKLEAFVENLNDNTPCPLCGSLHHPDLFKSEDIKELQKQISESQLNFEKQLKSISSISRQMSILETNYTEFKQRIDELKKVKEELNRNINKHSKLFVWDKYTTNEELNSAYNEMDLIQSKIKYNEAELTQKVKELNSKEDNLERARVKIEGLRNSLTKHNTELTTLQQQLQIINPHDSKEFNEEVIELERSRLLSEYVQIEKEYNSCTNQLQEKKKQSDRLKGRLESNNIELEKELVSIEDIEEKLKKELAESDFNSILEVEGVLSDSIDIRVEKQKIKEFNNSLLKSRSTFEQFQKEVGENKYDSEIHDQIKKEIDDISAHLGLMNKEHGRINELHKSLLKNIETQTSLRKELKSLEIRAENLKTMKSLFTASGFVNYISSVYLQNLCNAANDRFFQLTRQKLSLEITEDNNFRVRDFMNGGKVRNVKTLSGGQTFQASLSLALALADNIQKITESNQNFFFLDEGFGSLDKESLNIVFDTLKSLRKENRIVGVISHVEEMQHEIESHLHIENHDDLGSIILRSWANNY